MNMIPFSIDSRIDHFYSEFIIDSALSIIFVAVFVYWRWTCIKSWTPRRHVEKHYVQDA